METDLILAAELGQALLERNEELAATLEQREREVEVRDCKRKTEKQTWRVRKRESPWIYWDAVCVVCVCVNLDRKSVV